MKNFILILLTGLMISVSAFAQNYTITVNGTVSSVSGNLYLPVPDQPVIISVDSTNFGFTYQNTVYTDESGYYEDIIEMPGFNGFAMVMTMTYDSCLGYNQVNTAAIMLGATLPPMDFLLCNNSPLECQASFYYYQANPADPYTIAFVNTSYGEYQQVLWSFGDSTYSYDFNPVHTFPGPGTFYVCLTISGADCSSTFCDYVYVGGNVPGCENYFYYYNSNNDLYTLTFEGFLMNGQIADYYYWDFGDGTYGNGQTVTHTYTPQGIGIYMVGLTTMVFDPVTYDSCIYTSYQEVWLENNTGGCESFILPMNMYGLTVDFEGYTVSPYETQYTWEFGDGVTGTGQFVSHTYPSAGMYTVTLQTIDAMGCAYQTFTQIWLDSANTGGCNAMYTYEQTDSTTFNFYGYIYYNNGGIYPDSSAVYSWDFGDGTSETGQMVAHYFQPNPAGGYNVCLTATTVLPDGSTCTATYCEYISLAPPSFDIFGYVYLSNNTVADQAVVHLMTMDTTWQGVTEIQSMTIDSGGFYNFSAVPMYNSRLYFVQAELTAGSAYFGQYLPTYHVNALNWEQAMPILPLNNWTSDIFMIAGSPVDGGNGSITGIVSNLGTRGLLNDVEVVLMDSQKTPMMYTRSNEQGEFAFSNLPLGTYVIHAELMGIHTTQAEVTLSEQQPAASVEVQVSGGEANVVFGIPDQLVSLESASEIYPNPVAENARIDITLKAEASLVISTISLTGQVVLEEALDLEKGTHNIILESSAIPEGIYLVRIMTEHGDMMSRKLMVYR